ncbi:hypothetical protein AVEN_254457-1 [Araneus ventricosus]|uniref:Uncharacterized protein n=1 Tax=Araneus ventricosus TaxID=182803 RepID=A0A4Y2WSC7_ARAVE|nr:hypothetical protein AVEN_254457-1 [Araneus ventricosus]
MTSLHFITKAQFEAVYDHFKQVEEDDDATREELQIEYRLLLGYFQSVYEDSERKSNKVNTLDSRKVTKKSQKQPRSKERDVEDLKQKLSEMKEKLIERHRKEEMVLVPIN